MTAVLFAALLHASWNAIVKSGNDTFLDTLMVACGAALVAAATLPFLPPPAIESWPYLTASVILELAYYCLVAAAYRTGDLSYVYPIMRGSAPLLTALTGVTLAAFLFVRHRDAVMRRLQGRWRICLLGGLFTWASYAIALWAMMRAPVALVAALRETSVIFGTLLAAVVLKEKFGSARYVAAILVCAGAVLVKSF